MDAIARQPKLQEKSTAMLIAAALIEGIGFAALFCIIIKLKVVTTVGCNYCFYY
jgi:F0F1-type ATP synthase membrane subunit c/vacuolar-type H+-ATPase subunit K